MKWSIIFGQFYPICFIQRRHFLSMPCIRNKFHVMYGLKYTGYIHIKSLILAVNSTNYEIQLLAIFASLTEKNN